MRSTLRSFVCADGPGLAAAVALAASVGGCALMSMRSPAETKLDDTIRFCHQTMQSPPKTADAKVQASDNYERREEAVAAEEPDLLRSQARFAPGDPSTEKPYDQWIADCRKFFDLQRYEAEVVMRSQDPAYASSGDASSEPSDPPDPAAKPTAGPDRPARGPAIDRSTCSFKGKKLQGRVRVVTSFGDIKVQVVRSNGDLRVMKVDDLANACGRWQMVDSQLADFTVQFDDLDPDFTIEYTKSFPGVR